MCCCWLRIWSSCPAELRSRPQLAAMAAQQEIHEREKKGRRAKGRVVVGRSVMCRVLLLLAPYLVWLSYASVLNLRLLQLNKK